MLPNNLQPIKFIIMNLIVELLTAISILIQWIVILISKDKNRKGFKSIFYYVIFCTINELVNFVALYFKIRSLIFDNFFCIAEVVVLGFIFIDWIGDSRLTRRMKVILLSYAGFTAIYQIYFGIDQAFSELRVSFSIVVLLFGILYLNLHKSFMNNSNLTQSIFTFSVIFYFLSNSIIFSFEKFLLAESNKSFWVYYTVIHTSVNVTYNLLISLSLLKWKK